MKAYSVPICEAVDGKYSCVGTGFFVTPTLFVTAAHVLRDGGRYVQLGGEYLAFEVLFSHYNPIEGLDSDDLAIGKLPGSVTSSAVATLATEFPNPQAPCIIAGYKRNWSNADAPWFHEYGCAFGYDYAMRSPNRIRLGGTALQLNDGNMGGMSGGPITNEAGEVIGLLTGGGPQVQPRDEDAPRRPGIILWGVSYTHIAEVVATLT